MHAEMWIDRLLATDEGRRAPRGGDRRAVAVRARRPRRDAPAGAVARAQERLGRALPGRRADASRRPRGRARRAVGGDDLGATLRAAPARSGDGRRGLGGARGDPRSGDPGHLARRPRRREGRRGGRRHGARRLHADVHGLPRARGDAARDGGEDRRARRSARSARPPRRLVVDRRHNSRGTREASRGRLRAAHPEAGRTSSSSCSCSAASAARTAARRARSSRTSSARRRAARSVTARAAASRSSSSRRSDDRRRAHDVAHAGASSPSDSTTSSAVSSAPSTQPWSKEYASPQTYSCCAGSGLRIAGAT